MWLNLNEKIGHKPSPHLRQNTHLSGIVKKKTSCPIFESELMTLISGVMLVKREAGGKGKEAMRSGPALLRVLGRTDACTRWKQDKKVEG